MDNKKIASLLRRAAAGFETPGDLTKDDVDALTEDLLLAADGIGGENSYRLVVCIDVEAATLEGAYGIVRGMMNGAADGCTGWETSDEWYGPDEELGDPAELQAAVTAHMNRGNK